MKQPKSLEELVALLKKHRVPYIAWKKGPKDVSDLWEEIENGEVIFKRKRINRHMRLVRVASRSQIDIYIVRNRRLRKLFEGPQRYLQGTKVRYRSSERSVSEKIRQYREVPETEEEAAIRCFLEELGIAGIDLELLWICKPIPEPIKRSKTFPGLYDEYTNYRFRVMLPDQFYKKVYIEKTKKGRKTEFRWKYV